jgi:two-component system sensor kinase FixL
MRPSPQRGPGVGKGDGLTTRDEGATALPLVSPPSAAEPVTRLPAGTQAILAAAPDALLIADRRGRIVFVNAHAEALFGYAAAELIGQPLELLVPRLVGVRRDGTEFPAEINLRPLETEEGLLTVTAVRESEPSDLHRLVGRPPGLAQAQDAVRLRDEFLSIAAHELRTPLTALQLQLDGLEHSLRATEQPPPSLARMRDRVEKAVRNTTRLTDLVNSLVDLSRIMGGRLRLRIEEADLSALVREVVDDFSDPERTPSPVEVEAPVALLARCDRFRFEQILTNLLSNATKYGQGHPVKVRLASHDGFVEVMVRDHGIGVAAEDRERIFQKFERAVAAHSYGGMGLGLYISRYLAEAHGGSITIGETMGAGATFVLRLPLDPALAARDDS